MKTAFVLLFIGMSSYLFGQSIQPSVIASAGGTFTNGQLQLDWTIGETVIETVENGEHILTQGFHQPDIFTVSTLNFNENISLTLHPNPVQDQLHITGNLTIARNGQFQLFNAMSQLVWTAAFSGKTINTTIDMTSLASGVYFFTMISGDEVKGIQIIKVN